MHIGTDKESSDSNGGISPRARDINPTHLSILVQITRNTVITVKKKYAVGFILRVLKLEIYIKVLLTGKATHPNYSHTCRPRAR